MGEWWQFINPLLRREAPIFGTLRTFASMALKCRFCVKKAFGAGVIAMGKTNYVFRI
jgi:hypothetical protein